MHKLTIKRYLTCLEAAFLIKIVHRVDQKGKTFRRANFFKIYLTNPALRAALFEPIKSDDAMLGNLVETAIFAQWQHEIFTHLYYARWDGGEVDMVALLRGLSINWVAEIKWSDRYVRYPNELKSLLAFTQKNNISEVVVTTQSVEEKREFQHLTIHYVPAALQAYRIGSNLLDGNSVMIKS